MYVCKWDRLSKPSPDYCTRSCIRACLTADFNWCQFQYIGQLGALVAWRGVAKQQLHKSNKLFILSKFRWEPTRSRIIQLRRSPRWVRSAGNSPTLASLCQPARHVLPEPNGVLRRSVPRHVPHQCRATDPLCSASGERLPGYWYLGAVQ